MHKNKLYVLGAFPRRNGHVVREGRPRKQNKVLSLFSGAMGLDLGLEEAGFTIVACLEHDKYACETIRKNRQAVCLIEDDIQGWNAKRILNAIACGREEIMVIAGGPPCPSFSTAGRRRSFNDPSGQVMGDFLDIVNAIRPPYFIMENVRGILSAALKHRPIDQRQTGPLSLEELPGSVLRRLHDRFKKMGYTVTVELVNAANYGVPQSRERVIFLGSRDGFQITMPVGGYVSGGGLFQQPWRTLRDAIGDLKEEKPQITSFAESRLKYLGLLKEGQNWRNLPEHLIAEAMGGAYTSGGGKVGFYRRLSYDKPCPTVSTSPNQKSTCLCHPTELRPLSVKEYARIQQFPDSWEFAGSTAQKYRQIGNAVPVGLGYVVGRTVMRYIENYESLNPLKPQGVNRIGEGP